MRSLTDARFSCLGELILQHHERYPRMELQDLVKLVYQNEFAGGHMIVDEQSSLRRLRAEYEALDYSSEVASPAFEDIGNGLCRVNLRSIKGSGLQLTTLNRFFANTARHHVGEVSSFEEKLEVVKVYCRDGLLPYSLSEVETYLEGYRQQGYSPVSHSETYRLHYHPAYRVVSSVFRDFFPLFGWVDTLMSSDDLILVAIDGPSGSGKSTVAALIGEIYDCNVFHMDDFFLPPELRTAARFAEVGGNVDYVRFRQEILSGLLSGREFQYRPFDCQRMSLSEPVSVTPKKLNIVEGVYSLHPTLVDNYSLKVFLTVDSVEQLERIEQRNGPAMLQRFVREWIPLENRYFTETNLPQQCDLVFRS